MPHKKLPRILFILKYRETSDGTGGSYSTSTLSSGLLNSARMIKQMLDLIGTNGKDCETHLAQVIDNNCIDKEVTKFKPDIVIIEAIWVVPEKFEVLHKLHPNVKWIIRNHSNIPFLSQEGNALSWINEYVKKPNVFVATNTLASLSDLKELIASSASDNVVDKLVYFPNYYIPNCDPIWKHKRSNVLHVGCFGAIRPLKNHTIQAIAALKYARKHNKHLHFHINVGRVEGGGDPILKNLRSIFKNAINATLIEHPWVPHDQFTQVISKMDIALQVSFSETFNIVTADAVTMGVPVVVSSEVFWVSKKYHASPTDSDDIVKKITIAIDDSHYRRQDVNQAGLFNYNKQSHKDISNTINLIL